MRFFAGPTLLVTDELGYLPLPTGAAAALFQVISQRHLKSSTVLTTNRGDLRKAIKAIIAAAKSNKDHPFHAVRMLGA